MKAVIVGKYSGMTWKKSTWKSSGLRLPSAATYKLNNISQCKIAISGENKNCLLTVGSINHVNRREEMALLGNPNDSQVG